MSQYSGQCLCGACRYTIEGVKPIGMYLCHCSRCRKETGSAHAATVFLNDAKLSWDKGENQISHFHLEGTRKHRSFCKTCGCPLPWVAEDGSLVLPAGSLDNDTFLEPTAHIHCASRSSWEDKLIDLKRFEAFPF